jgi:hypothetical protein
MRKLPDTSHAAKASFTDVMKSTHHKKIVEALKILGKGNYEIIGNYIGMKNINQIARRLKEMMPPTEDNPTGLNLIFKPGTKSKTSSGREAYDYCLTNNHPKVENPKEKSWLENDMEEKRKEFELKQLELFG